MNEWFALMCASAAFYAAERSGRAPRFHWPARTMLIQVAKETAELFFAAAVLMLIYALAAAAAGTPYERRELAVLFFWPAAYGVYSLTRRPAPFFMALLAACLTSAPAGPWTFNIAAQCAASLAGFVICAGLFRLAVAGLEARLVFSPVPRVLAGLPILLILAAFVSFCGWGLAAGWPFTF